MNRQSTRAALLLAAMSFASVPLAMAQENPPVQVKKVPIHRTSATSGKQMFNEYCASCHGINAKGNGPAAPALKVRPPDLTTLAERHSGKYPATYVQNVLMFGVENFPAHGAKDMPIWGPVLSSIGGSDYSSTAKLRIYNIARYIETLQVK